MTALDGTTLTIDDVLDLGTAEHPAIDLDVDARDRVAASHALATALADRRAVYAAVGRACY